MDRILRSSSATVQVTLYDENGDPANPPGGTLTADVTDSGGTAISGSPFSVTNPPASIGVLKFTLPAPGIAVLDAYDVTWNIPDGSKRFTQFEVVGGFLFTIAELRAFDDELTDATAYPASAIVDVREQVEERLEGEEACGVAFVPRGAREVLDGSGEALLELAHLLPRTVLSAEIDGVALDAAALADLRTHDWGAVSRKTLGAWTSGQANVEILYEHGFDRPPAPIVRAAKILAKKQLVDSPISEEERALSVTTELGTMRISTPGRDGPTGIPEVDAVIEQFGKRVPTAG